MHFAFTFESEILTTVIYGGILCHKCINVVWQTAKLITWMHACSQNCRDCGDKPTHLTNYKGIQFGSNWFRVKNVICLVVAFTATSVQ